MDDVIDGGAEFDMESAVEEVGSGLGLGIDEPADTSATEDPDLGQQADTDVPADDKAQPQVTAKQPPGSWAKESHALWGSIPAAAQDQILFREEQIHKGIEQYREHNDFGRAMKEVVSPYMATITAQGLDAPKAVGVLLNAHHRLTNGSPQEKQAYFANLARSYGIELPAAGQQPAQVDPAVRQVQEEVAALKNARMQEQQAQTEQKRQETMKTVSAFADAQDDKGNKIHPYFDECSDHIVNLVKAGYVLDEAYRIAVYANPVTEQKELARVQKEANAKLREKAKTDAQAALKARSSNVRTRDTNRTPTEPKGKLFGAEYDADMQAILDRSRQTH